ncbi:hypothetical protein CYMTET_44325 [Cymbomonas tetramitiformis]|uniref:Uncharacterized protein n=1 Tax=Cymbomonas tetramitiformis TaxID=36881 RepID=A0AAE0C1L6_9CHLO|nr:hypothetical protein CYMTET_44325 [Cymbomonas tetramitiformis]
MTLHAPQHGPRSEERRCIDASEAECKLEDFIAPPGKVLLQGIKCYICQSYGLPRQICKNGHTICETCDSRDNGELFTICGICKVARMSQSVDPPVLIKELYKGVQDHVCPLCTDGTKRSMEELLKHVQEGKCAAVIGERVQTNESCLKRNRAMWEEQICETLQREEFVNLAEQFIQDIMDKEARQNEAKNADQIAKIQALQLQFDSCSGLLSPLRAKLGRAEETNVQYEKRIEDMSQYTEELSERCNELVKERNALLQEKVQNERRWARENSTYKTDRDQLRTTNRELNHDNNKLKRDMNALRCTRDDLIKENNDLLQGKPQNKRRRIRDSNEGLTRFF